MLRFVIRSFRHGYERALAVIVGEQDSVMPEPNPFAPPDADLTAAMAGAWRKHGLIAGGLFTAILVGDLSFALGFFLPGIVSLAARMVLVLMATLFAPLAALLFAIGRRHVAKEYFAAGAVFGGVALASVPPALLLWWQ